MNSPRGVQWRPSAADARVDIPPRPEIPVSLQIAPFLNAVVVNRGSDLHIKAAGPPRIRISGSLVPLQVDPLTADQSWEMILETMPADIASSEEHTSELQSLMPTSYALFCSTTN